MLSETEHAISVANGGAESVLLVRGALGRGKTRLLRDVRAEVATECVWLSPSRTEVDLPLSGVSALLAALEIDGQAVSGTTCSSVPALAEAVLAALPLTSANRRVLLIDDIDRFDPKSQAVLAFFLRRIGRTGLNAVATTTHPIDASAFTGLPSITLRPLPSHALTEVIQSGTDHKCCSAVASWICLAACGAPGLALRIVESLSPEQIRGRAAMPLPYLLPHEVAQAILDDTSPLEHSAHEALAIVSTMDAAPASVVAAVHPAGTLGIARLIETGVLVRVGKSVRFRDQMMRSAVYGCLDPLERQQLHEKLLSKTHGWLRLWHASHSLADAKLLLRLAVVVVETRPGLGAALIERALALEPRGVEAAGHLVSAALRFLVRNDLVSAIRYLTFARRVSPSTDALSLARMTTIELVANILQSGQACPRTDMSQLRASPYREAALESHTLIAVLHLAEWNTEAAGRHLREVRFIESTEGLHRDALSEQAEELHASLDRGEMAPRPVPTRAKTADSSTVRCAGEALLTALLYSTRGEHPEARAQLRAGLEASRADLREAGEAVTTPTLYESVLTAYAVLVDARAGDVGSALRIIRTATTQSDQLAVSRASWSFYASWLSAEQSDGLDAREFYELGLRFAGKNALSEARGWVELERARIDMYEDQSSDSALRKLEHLVEHAKRIPVFAAARADLVELRALSGDLHCAQDSLAALETENSARPGLVTQPALERARASAAATGDTVHLFERATQATEDSGVPYEHGRTLLAFSGALARAGFSAKSAATAREAGRVFRADGLNRWAQATSRLAMEGRTGAAESPADLDPKLHAVVQLVRTGRTNREIAMALSVSLRTVEVRLTSVYRRLGIASRAELMALMDIRDRGEYAGLAR